MERAVCASCGTVVPPTAKSKSANKWGKCQIFSSTCIFPPRGGGFAFVGVVFPLCFCQFCVNCAIFVDIVRFAWYNIQAIDCNCQSCAFATSCIIQHMEVYRSGHNEAVLKTSFVCLCNFLKTLDFIGFFASSDALCEKPFSQFSRKFP